MTKAQLAAKQPLKTHTMQPKRPFHVPRSIKAQMVERYIFNFRMKPEDLEKHLPAPFLKPQVKNGWSMMSFCILNLDKITLPPLPAILRFKTLSCAYRAGIIDHSNGAPEPSVWITDRNSNLRIIDLLSPLIIRDGVPRIDAAIGHDRAKGVVHTQFSFMDGQHYFSAEAKVAEDTYNLDSEVFDNVDEFAQFIKAGVSSYTPSSRKNHLASVDLYKEDVKYEALDARIEFSWLQGEWKNEEMIFDSAVKATGSSYKWTYRGLVKI